MSEKRIKAEIDNHQKTLKAEVKQLMLWNSDLNKWTENIRKGIEKDVTGRVKLIADQSNAMVKIVDRIDELENTIALKENLLKSIEGFEL